MHWPNPNVRTHGFTGFAARSRKIIINYSSNRFPCVNLHIPGVAASGITCCPDLDPILAWFAWDVLFEWTATSERDQALVHCHLRAWIVHQRSALHPPVPNVPDGSQFVVSPAERLCSSVIKSDNS